MGETKSAESTKKKGFFSNVKSEFGKIIWPSKNTVAKQSFAVIVISAILAAFIACLDMGLIEVINKFLNIG